MNEIYWLRQEGLNDAGYFQEEIKNKVFLKVYFYMYYTFNILNGVIALIALFVKSILSCARSITEVEKN